MSVISYKKKKPTVLRDPPVNVQVKSLISLGLPCFTLSLDFFILSLIDRLKEIVDFRYFRFI